MSGLSGIVQLTALALSLAVGWLLTHQRTRSLSVELIAPTWRRLAKKHGWRFIDGTLGIDSRLEGDFKGYRFTARAAVESGQVLLAVPLHHPSTNGASLKVAVPSFSSVELIDALTVLVSEARELDELGSEDWDALASQHGLSQSTRRGMKTMRGEIEGRSVRIGTQDNPLETVIRVRIGPPWPASVFIQPRPSGSASSFSTGNPILDGLVTVTGDVNPRVRDVLCDPRVAEDLIAILHPYPRSSVVGGHVQMHCPGHLEEQLQERLADALSLASRLQGTAGS